MGYGKEGGKERGRQSLGAVLAIPLASCLCSAVTVADPMVLSESRRVRGYWGARRLGNHACGVSPVVHVLPEHQLKEDNSPK